MSNLEALFYLLGIKNILFSSKRILYAVYTSEVQQTPAAANHCTAACTAASKERDILAKDTESNFTAVKNDIHTREEQVEPNFKRSYLHDMSPAPPSYTQNKVHGTHFICLGRIKD